MESEEGPLIEGCLFVSPGWLLRACKKASLQQRELFLPASGLLRGAAFLLLEKVIWGIQRQLTERPTGE